MKRIWQDLDLFNDQEWKCPEDASRYKAIVDANRIFKFLAGLNEDFDEVRGRIIGRSPLPSIHEAFSEVRREETRRGVMLNKKSTPINNPESSAFTSEANISKRHAPLKTEEKPRVWCDHCNRPRHTRETCWYLHGKPADWKPRNKRQPPPTANAATDQSSPFSKEQINQLLSLLSSNSATGTPNCSMVHTGRKLNPWIIDSGASDHMTNLHHLFYSYNPCSGHEKVRIADGSFSSIAGRGHINLSASIGLKSVLHVPKLKCNLLSVSKLSKDSNCRVIFCESSCVFQDQKSGMMIGRAKAIGGLYYFEDIFSSNKEVQAYSSMSSNPKLDKIMEWHLRLGHPSFSYLRHLFPQLFKGVDCALLQCETCFLAKSHRYKFCSKTLLSFKAFFSNS